MLISVIAVMVGQSPDCTQAAGFERQCNSGLTSACSVAQMYRANCARDLEQQRKAEAAAAARRPGSAEDEANRPACEAHVFNFEGAKRACDGAIAQAGAAARQSAGCQQAAQLQAEVDACVNGSAARVAEDRDRKAAADAQARATADQAVDAEQRRLAFRAELVSHPKTAQLALSWILCHNLVVRAGAKKEIADELKYAKEGGGVVDKVLLHDNQDEMKAIDEANATVNQVFKARKLTPIACAAVKLTEEAAIITPQLDDQHYVTLGDDAPWLLR